jgi:hypothetical protein
VPWGISFIRGGTRDTANVVFVLLISRLGGDNDNYLDRPVKIAIEGTDLGCVPNTDGVGSDAKCA